MFHYFFDSWSCFFAWDMGLLCGSDLNCVAYDASVGMIKNAVTIIFVFWLN